MAAGDAEDLAAPGQVRRPRRVLISYAHEDEAHELLVQDLWVFLIGNGIDAGLDVTAAQEPQNWARWMLHEIRDADFVLVVASPEYKRRAEWDAAAGEGSGVQWEGQLLAQEVYADPGAALQRILPVVLPGRDRSQVPVWLSPATNTVYTVDAFTVAGAEALLRYLLGRPAVAAPELGAEPDLPTRVAGSAATAPAEAGIGDAAGGATEAVGGSAGAGLRTRVDVHAQLVGGVLTASTVVAGRDLGLVSGPYPGALRTVWAAARLGAGPAADRYAAAGDALAVALFDANARRVLAGIVDRLTPGNGVDFVLHAGDEALVLPWELLRLAALGGVAGGPLCLRAGVTMRRQVTGAPLAAPVAWGGPLKVLAAVAAPEESLTDNDPLDVEAQMQAVLDATADFSGPTAIPGTPSLGGAGSGGTGVGGQVQILEVASLPQITAALDGDAYHVLHLFAHGSPTTVELTDEDGAPHLVDVDALVEALRRGGRPVPLIMLAACSGAAQAGAAAMAAGLVRRGADRVIAFQAPVTEVYATRLARDLYREILTHPGRPLAQALATARYATEEHLAAEDARVARQGTTNPARTHEARPPEWGLATLLSAADDAPVIDRSARAELLRQAMTLPSGGSVRELSLGQLIGRRRLIRDTTAILRRTPDSVDDYGLTAGAVLVGIGGIGKTALAGRVATRLRGDGWRVAVHDGTWNPAALLTAAAHALTTPTRPGDAVSPQDVDLAEKLVDARYEDAPRIQLLASVLAARRVLVVFDDFEQNLTPAEEFLDPTLADVLALLAHAATHTPQPGRAGGLLLTCRHPLPGSPGEAADDLVELAIPPLTPSERRRLFRRLAKLDGLAPDDQHLVEQAIGGHPRLLEFVDALLRAGRSSLAHVQDKLRDLADKATVDLRRNRAPEDAITAALAVGAADILLTDLLDLLTPSQAEALRQAAVCRCTLTPDDLARALAGNSTATADPSLRSDLDRLTDFTLGGHRTTRRPRPE